MKNLLILLILLGSAVAHAQDVFRDSTITDTTAYPRLVIETGLRIPVGNLADKVGTSAEFGAWWRTRIAHNNMLDAGFSLYVPQNPQDFSYRFEGADYTTKAIGVSGMVGVRLCKVYSLGTRSSVEWISSYGYAFFTYYDEAKDQAEAAQPGRKTLEDDNTHTIEIDTYARGFSTFHIGQGVRLNIGRLSFYGSYNFTPYGLLSSYVPDNFGSHSISVVVQVRI
ncbi:MAG: hypothetical protein V4581_02090 [Bacteroidota bacterium]